MSVINQVLLELEKRRASAAERGALPSHVRALPDEERSVNWGWIAAGGLATVGALGGWWVLQSGVIDLALQRLAPTPAAQRGAGTVVGKVAAAPTAVTTDARSRAESDAQPERPAAARLSLELSSAPATLSQGHVAAVAPAAEPVVSQPLPTSQIVSNPASDSFPRREAAAPAPRPEPARPAAVVASAKAPTGPPAETQATKAASGAPAAKAQIQKQERQPTPRELADNEYRKAATSLHQGRSAEAEEGFQAALNLYSTHHGARQGLVGLLVATKRFEEAERVLQDGLKLAPAQTGFTMTLARIQVDRGDNAQATTTLQKGLEYAQGNADYHAFLATLLQRQNRHEEAIEHFQGALRVRPAVGVWWLGLGISLQAVNRAADAQEAYRRARATNSLNPDLAAFAEQRMRQLQ